MKRLFSSSLFFLLLLVAPVLAQAELSPNTQVFYYLHDHLGGIETVLDDKGGVVCQQDYLPFGQERMADCDEEESYGFTGKEKDDETGLMYYGARYYDPAIGKFTSQDPVTLGMGSIQSLEGILGNPQTLNPYSYVVNNPVNHVDPTGEFYETLWDAANTVYDFGSIAKNELEIAGNGIQYLYGSVTDNPVLQQKAVENYDRNTQELQFALTSMAADTAATAIPFVPAGMTKAKKIHDGLNKTKFIYRSGTIGQMVRKIDKEKVVSFTDRLANPVFGNGKKINLYKPGGKFIKVDITKLPKGSFKFDGGLGGRAPGHVSVSAPKDAIIGAINYVGKLSKIFKP